MLKNFDHLNEDLSIGERMLNLAKSLYPFNRSLMGPDIRDSFQKFINLNPEFEELRFYTGEKVFDWEIPQEWIIRDAFLEHESGRRFAEFKKCNLHLMGYSTAVDKIFSKDDLISKISTIPGSPTSIPYVTSYYKKNWGFCLAHNQFLKLPEGKYRVFIDSEHKPGYLNLIESIIPGESKKEIFFSTYLCHPSLANNELSGPVLLNEVLNFVKGLKNRKYTYRFVILPETLGSIAYLSKRYKLLNEFMMCGFNLSCVGDDRSYSHVSSRLGNNLADQALSASLIGLKNVKSFSFLDRGSDERQYCAPGIDLPVCTFCRTKFGCYPEYHTSDDNFNVVTANGLLGSYNVLINIIKSFEIGLYPSINVLGEPQLSKRGLYPNLSNYHQGINPAKNRMNIIAYCDSKHSIFDIAKKVNIDLSIVLEEIQELKSKGLIDNIYIH